MKKTLAYTTAMFLCILLLTTIAFAHPGRTDANGGHYDRSTGIYHYHNGGSGDAPGIEPPAPESEQASPGSDTADKAVPTVNAITVTVDGEAIAFDQPPEIIGDRVLVPVRFVAEKIGCAVAWDGDTQTVYVTEASFTAVQTAVKQKNINVVVNDAQIVFPDQPPVNLNGRILIPIRYVVEPLGYLVEWAADTRTVIITKN